MTSVESPLEPPVEPIDTEAEAPVARFLIVRDGFAVMEIEDRPGHLHSTAPLPEGQTAPAHPFVHAVSRDPMSEHTLRQALLASRDFHQFTERVIAAGFDLAGGNVSPWAIEDPARRITDGEGAVVAAAWPIAGTFTTLDGTRGGEFAHALVTVYQPAHEPAIAQALEDSSTFAAFVEKLEAAGYRVTVVT